MTDLILRKLKDTNTLPLYVRGKAVKEESGAYAADGLKDTVRAWEASSARLTESITALVETLESSS